MTFKEPGPMHHARWMSKALYALKIYLFRDFIVLTSAEMEGIVMLCQFLLLIFIKYWFLCPLSTSAPANDLQKLKDLVEFKSINPKLANAVLQKDLAHLWYLSDKFIGAAVFDSKLSSSDHQALANAILHTKKQPAKSDRATVKISQIPTLTLSSFVTIDSLRLFKQLCIPTGFLQKDPTLWSEDEGYKEGLEVVKALKVANDLAERGVSAMSEFNNILTKDEKDKQRLLRKVCATRKKYPKYTKSSLSK